MTVGATSRVNAAELNPIKNLTNPTSEILTIPEEKPDPPKPKPIVKYKTVKNDTLTKISEQFKVSVDRIFNKNTQLASPDVLKVDEEITIPEPSEKLESRISQPTVEKPSEPIKNTPHDGSIGLNGYYSGQCTGWVAQHRYVPPGWGDASNWRNAALRAGWTVSATPVPGAIGWRPGHVVYVESVGAGVVTISEQNYDWNSGIREITIPTSSYLYIY